jgi:GT2 family glycosyltransferase
VEKDAVGSISLKTLAIIVNYKVAALALKAVESVLASDSDGMVQVAVVDNSEDEDEAERLRQGLPCGVLLLVNSENVGFGRACNRVVDRFPADRILLINPDARLLPGCLRRLQSTLSSREGVAAVSPRIFWDAGLRFLLPFSYPECILHVQALLDASNPQAPVNRILSAAWRAYSIRIWRARRPVRVKNLSGALVLLDAAAVRKAGGLFDPRFFLYFEDTDLFLRLRQAGYSLLVEPRAGAIHHYDQCARENREWKRVCMMRSRQIFLEKHRPLRRLLIRSLAARAQRPAPQLPITSDFTSHFSLKVPSRLQRGWLFEWSPTPTLIPSSAQFGAGPVMDFPEACWDMLAPGHYFGRIGAPRPFARTSRLLSWVVQERVVS